MRLLQLVDLDIATWEQIVKMAPNGHEVHQNSLSDKDKVMIDNIIMSLST